MAIAGIALSQPSIAQVENSVEPVSRGELRELLIKMTELLDRAGSTSDAAVRLRQRIDSMDAQAFEHLYQFSGNWKKLRIAVALMSAGADSIEKQSGEGPRFATGTSPRLASPAGLPANLFATAYPMGSNYNTFRATLPGLGAMIDTPGSLPGLNDERCDANFEAGVAIASATFAFANIIAETVCEALPELGDIPCWVAQGALQVAAEANNTVGAQCAIVDGAVDAAEIEAAYENTIAIYNNLDAHHVALGAHDTAIKTAVTNATTILSTALAAHDAGIKALLANLQTVVNQNAQQLKVNQALQRQVIRLLLTPEGQRSVDPAVLTCTGDNCPKVLNCPGDECHFPIKR
jgi:hypothetical protein